MPIFADDLQFYAAEQMTDADDAGGYSSNNKVLDNVDNNVFPDIASGDRIAGRTHLRKIVAAVRSPDTDTLMAGRAYMASPPSDPAVSVGLLVTGVPSDQRQDAVETLYTHAQKNLNTNYRLYQNYSAGDTTLILYSFTNQTIPVISGNWYPAGAIICLEDSANNEQQYVQITNSSVGSYGDTYTSLTLTITPPLKETFRGSYSAVVGYVTPTQIYTTRSVPMAFGVYGITALASPAKSGDLTLSVENLEVPIAPTLLEVHSASLRLASTAVKKNLTVAAVNSRMQSATISPMPTLDDISVSYYLSGGGSFSISGAVSPGLFAVSGTTITVTLPQSPFATQYELHTPTLTATTVSAYTYYFSGPFITGSFTVNAVRNDTGALLAAADNGSGGLTGYGISGTLNYTTGQVDLTFTTAVRLETIHLVFSQVTAYHVSGQGTALQPVSSWSFYHSYPVIPSSITVTAIRVDTGAQVTATDNGSGVISGTGISGLLNYSIPGWLSLTFTNEVYINSIYIQYSYREPIDKTIPRGFYPVSSYSVTLGHAIDPGTATVVATDPTGTVHTATDDGANAFNADGITGTVNYTTGAVALTFSTPVLYSTISIQSHWSAANAPIQWYYGTAADGTTFSFNLTAPMKPGSVSVSAAKSSDGSALLASDNGLGALTGGASGTVTYATGQISVVFSASVTIPSIVIAYQYTQPSALNQIIGGSLDTVRLPPSKSYPMVRAGDVVIVHYPVSDTLPNPVVAGTTYTLSRSNIDQIWIEDAVGTRIPAAKYTSSRAAGSVTMAATLDLAAYNQPLKAWTVVSDEVLATSIDANNRRVTLNRSLTHTYPATVSYLSSQVQMGDLQATISIPFAQQAWTSVWQNDVIGTVIAPQFNHAGYPLIVSNNGAITERWRITFTASTVVTVTGEHVGQIASGLSTTSPIAPINPMTGKPYFTIPYQGWGGGWVSGNLLRFNTTGADFAIWPIRCVQPSDSPAPGTSDRFRLTFVGDVNA